MMTVGIASPKPRQPVGILPYWLWLEQREKELSAAIGRYKEAGLSVPSEWTSELQQLRARLGAYRFVSSRVSHFGRAIR